MPAIGNGQPTAAAAAPAAEPKPSPNVMSRGSVVAAGADAKVSTVGSAGAAAPIVPASITSSISAFGYGMFSAARTAVKAVPFVSDATYATASANISNGLTNAVSSGDRMLRSAGNQMLGVTAAAINQVSPESVAPTLHSYVDSASGHSSRGLSAVTTGTVTHITPRVESVTLIALGGAAVTSGVSNASGRVMDSMDGGVRRVMTDSGVVSDEQLRSSSVVQMAEVLSALMEMVGHLQTRLVHLSTADILNALSAWSELQNRVADIEMQTAELREQHSLHQQPTASSAAAAAPKTSSAIAVHAAPIAVTGTTGAATVYRVMTVQQHNSSELLRKQQNASPVMEAGEVSNQCMADAKFSFPADSVYDRLTATLHAYGTPKRTSELYPPLPPKSAESVVMRRPLPPPSKQPEVAINSDLKDFFAAPAASIPPAAAAAGATSGGVAAASGGSAASNSASLSSAAAASKSVPHEISTWQNFSRPTNEVATGSAGGSGGGSASINAANVKPVAPPLPPSQLPIPLHPATPGPTSPLLGVDFHSELQYAMRLAACAYGSYFLKFLGFAVSLGSGEKLVEEMCGIPASDVVSAKWHSDIHAPGYFIAVDRRRQRVVLCVRGTSRVMDAITDLNCDYLPLTITHPKPVSASAAAGGGGGAPPEMMQTRGWCHEGIAQSANWFDTNIKSQLKSILKQFPHHELVLTGHSLGAAVPSILALCWMTDPDLSPPNRPLKCYAFGPPCVVSLNLSVLGRAHVISIGNGHDLIPKLSKGAVHDLATVILRLSPPLQTVTPHSTAASTASTTSTSSTATAAANPAGSLLLECLKHRSAPGTAQRQSEDRFAIALYREIRALQDGEHLYPVGHFYQLWPTKLRNPNKSIRRSSAGGGGSGTGSSAYASAVHSTAVAAAAAADIKSASAAAGGSAAAPGTIDLKSNDTPYSFITSGFADRLDTSIGCALYRSSVHPSCHGMPPLSQLMVSQHLPEQYYNSLCGPMHTELAVALPIASLATATAAVVVKK